MISAPTRWTASGHKLCNYICLDKKRESPSQVQFRDLVAEPDGAITSDFTFESSLRLCPERYCVSDFSQSRWAQRDVEGATIVRALSNHPTGGLERVRSANQTCPLHDQHLRQLGNLESPVLLQQPQDENCETRQVRRRQVAIVQPAQMASALPGCRA